MAIIDCMTVSIVISFGIVIYALYQKREVKAIFKIPFVTFFFEARGGVGNISRQPKEQISVGQFQSVRRRKRGP